MEKYLVINGGSSSLKFSLYQIEDGKEINIVNGLVERIGIDNTNCILKCGDKKVTHQVEAPNHTVAVEVMLDKLKEYNFIEDISEIKGVGHRVLHGGEYYNDSVIIDDTVLNNIKSLIPFGPLHLPGEISAIESMKEVLPTVPQIAVFDTAFHQTIPENNYLYAIPRRYYTDYGIRKYGFHGTSHKYITEAMKRILNKEKVNIIACHVGNGSSECAVKDSKSLNTTMGFTPLDGVIMGTRSGSIDPSILEYICDIEGIDVRECTNILNKKSGLLGISEYSSDIRDIINAQNTHPNCAQALKMLEDSLARVISQYIIELDGDVDGIVFTAGIGENNPFLRENILNKFSRTLGIKVDKSINDNVASFKDIKEARITTDDSRIHAYVIPTDEESMILKDTVKLSKEYKNQKKLIKEN